MLADGGQITNTQGAVDIWSLVSEAMFQGGKSKSGDGQAKEPEKTEPAPQ